jgi:hypothetical protein
MTAVCETLGVARSNIARRVAQGPSKRRGRPPLPDEPLLSEIMAVIAEMPSYGYPRVWAVLRRRSQARGDPPANRKRVYRLMTFADRNTCGGFGPLVGGFRRCVGRAEMEVGIACADCRTPVSRAQRKRRGEH